MRCPHCKQLVPKPGMPRHAFQPWTPQLDDLMRRYCRVYKELAMPVEEAIPLLMDRFGRSHASIYSRLFKLDLITE